MPPPSPAAVFAVNADPAMSTDPLPYDGEPAAAVAGDVGSERRRIRSP